MIYINCILYKKWGRERWFRKKTGHMSCCAKLFYLTPIPKFHFKMFLFNLAHGLRKFWLLHFVQIKIHFAHFGGLNKMFEKIFNLEFSFWQVLFDIKGRYLQKIFIFKVPAIFLKWKLCCAAHFEICRMFGIELIKMYLIGSTGSIF